MIYPQSFPGGPCYTQILRAAKHTDTSAFPKAALFFLDWRPSKLRCLFWRVEAASRKREKEHTLAEVFANGESLVIEGHTHDLVLEVWAPVLVTAQDLPRLTTSILVRLFDDDFFRPEELPLFRLLRLGHSPVVLDASLPEHLPSSSQLRRP